MFASSKITFYKIHKKKIILYENFEKLHVYKSVNNTIFALKYFAKKPILCGLEKWKLAKAGPSGPAATKPYRLRRSSFG